MMKVTRHYYEKNDEYVVVCTFTGADTLRCVSYPFKDRITPEQAHGIIEDAVLLSYGLQAMPEEKKNAK